MNKNESAAQAKFTDDQLSNRTWCVAIGLLATLAVGLRVPSISNVPINWDAVQYILALDDFNLSEHQPHPPGTPLYVLLGRVANLLVADGHQALILISLLAGAGLVVGGAVFTANVADRSTGLLVGALLLVNPWVWTYSVVALPYTLEGLFATTVAFAAWKCRTSSGLVPSISLASAVGVAGGIRPSVLPFLGLLFLFGLYWQSWRTRLVTIGMTAIATLLWLVPLIHFSGGLDAYVEETRALSEASASQTSVFIAGPGSHWIANLQSLLFAMLVLTLPLLGLTVLSIFRSRVSGARLRLLSPQALLLLGWIIPPIAFFFLIHFGQPGYLVLVSVPVLIGLALPVRQTFWTGNLWTRPVLVRATPVLILGLVMSVLASAPLKETESTWESVEEFLTEHELQNPALVANRSYRIASYLEVAPTVINVAAKGDGTDSVWGPRHVARDGRQQYGLGDRYPICEAIKFREDATIVLTEEPLISRIDRNDRSWTQTTLSGNQMEIWYRQISRDDVLYFSSADDNMLIRVVGRSEIDSADNTTVCQIDRHLMQVAEK